MENGNLVSKYHEVMHRSGSLNFIINNLQFLQVTPYKLKQ